MGSTVGGFSRKSSKRRRSMMNVGPAKHRDPCGDHVETGRFSPRDPCEWKRLRYLWLKGKPRGRTGAPLSDAEVVAELGLDEPPSAHRLASVLSTWHGSFAGMLVIGDAVACFVDKLRSIPLFVDFSADSPIVTDHLSNTCSGDWTSMGRSELLAFSVVLGNETLLPAVRALEVAQVCFLGADGNAQFIAYHDFFGGETPEQTRDCEHSSESALEGMLERMATVLAGRPILITLSGGHDSRFMVCAAKTLGFSDIICVSYGREGSFEIETARRVARQLGVRLEVVLYDENTWKGLLEQGDTNEVTRRQFNASVVPCLQELPAFQILHREGRIDPNAVVIPGYCGDFLGGSKIPVKVKAGFRGPMTLNGLARIVLSGYASPNGMMMIQEEQRLGLLDHIRVTLDSEQDSPLEVGSWVRAAERWFFREKIAKYIVGALRVPEHWGHDWYLPLWDDAWATFWLSVPLDDRVGRSRYERFMEERFFQPMGVAFPRRDDLGPSRTRTLLKRMIPRVLHGSVIRGWHRIKGRGDVVDINRFDVFVTQIREQLQVRSGIRVPRDAGLPLALAMWMMDAGSNAGDGEVTASTREA
jgi:asparagine synthase (glutamine-hydrolysing)